MMSLDMNYDTILYTFLIACGINNASTTYFLHILVVGYNPLAQKLAQVDDYKSIFIACGIKRAYTTYFSHILVVGYNALAQKLAQVDDYKSIFEKAHLDKGCTLRLESGWLSLSYTII